MIEVPVIPNSEDDLLHTVNLTMPHQPLGRRATLTIDDMHYVCVLVVVDDDRWRWRVDHKYPVKRKYRGW